MKHFLLTLVSVCLIGTAYAEDKNWQTSEHNYNFESDVWGLEIRTIGNDDYDHVEGKFKMTKDLELALRYAEDGANTEIRPKLTHKILKAGPLSLAHRIEYRYFEGTKDDNWRYRGIVGLNAGNAWIKMQPRWSFGAGKTGDAKIDDVKWQAGYDISLASKESTKVAFTPYVEYLQSGEKDSWVKQHMIVGTRLKVKF